MKAAQKCLALTLALLLQTSFADALEKPALVLTFEQAQTAGIDGRDWNKSFVGATTADAVHRAVLIRFPSIAEAIREQLDRGQNIEKVEVVLDFGGTEIVPEGYLSRPGLGEKKWKENPPQWHVVAWALRRPWIADKELGPTFNAYLNGAGFWTKYGASDTDKDRFAPRFGPSELSNRVQQGRLDITTVLTDPAFADDFGARLRLIEENGFLLKKLETYDVRYRDASDAYEWAVPTGGHGVRFKNPRLVVTFRRDDSQRSKQRLTLPRPTNFVALVTSLKLNGSGGKPSAVMPSAEELKVLVRGVALKRPAEMTDSQFAHVMELYRVGGDNISDWMKAAEAGDRKQYERLIREISSTPPRYWKGWSIQDDLLLWYLCRDLLPAPVQDHIKAYWKAWLMPDIPTRDLFHPQSKQAADYWERTKDWRGRTSFFRGGYNLVLSTQNFNHTAAMGALLGGNIIGAEYAMADGRHGLEHFPLRLWAMLDGSTQEMLDHYYLSITLSAQKMFADFAPTALDRLIGRIMLDRTIELLATAYHPKLRRFVNASGRARLSGVLVEQDGIYGVLHTLSQQGAINNLEQPFNATVRGMPVWGYDFPPGRVAVQSLQSKWGADWLSNVIDHKAFPFEETSSETTRGNFNPPLWRHMYLGHHYGLASQDIKGGTIDIMAQWNHSSVSVSAMEDLSTLTLRYAVNEPDMATTQGGMMPYAGGVVTFQNKNRAIVFTKPRTEKERTIALAGNNGLQSLSTVAALWNFRGTPSWELYVDGRKITTFPVSIKAGQVITIKDGVSYIGIIPLPATDLGRKDEVVIGFGGEGRSEPNGAAIKPALIITSFNLQKETPMAFDLLDWPAINTATYGGFIIELGDIAEYGDFTAFSQRMKSNTVATDWDPEKKLFRVTYRSGKDLMEAGFTTDFEQSEVHFAVPPGQQTKAIPYRRLNGSWPYLPTGIDRDTTLSQQGTTGRLEKNGAVLLTEKDHKSYLITEPRSGTYTGYNPLPDPTSWYLSVPGGVTIRANGKVGLLRVAVRPKENRLSIDYATKPDQNGPEMADSLLAVGFATPPVVVRDGKLFREPLKTTPIDGKTGYIVPLN